MSCERSNTSMTTSSTLTNPVVSNVNANKITERRDGDSTIVKVDFEQNVTAASPEELWETRYKDLVSFVKEFGHARVPYNFPPNTSLGYWVSHQRGYYKDVQKGKPSVSMTEYRIRLLEEVGFEWEVKVPKWDTRYEELSYFVKEFGHARVPQIFRKNPSLGNWVRKQRAGRKKMLRGDPSSMTKRRLELLDNIYFEWEGRGKGDVIPSEEWEVKYEELVSFVKEFGHARVPKKYLKNPSLGNWVSKQRIYHKMIPKGNTPVHLTDQRISLLEKVGFEWEAKKNPEWDEQYKHLVSFVKEFGHSRVPSKFSSNPSLGYWVNRQRTYYQKIQKGESSTLTEDQINLLNKVDFEWNCKAGAEVVVLGWDARYKDLLTFINEFGHTRVPYNYPPNTTLGRWVDSQRLSYKKFREGDTSARMTECRIGLLKKVNFEWVIRVPEWDTRYKELVSFIEEFGHSRIPKRSGSLGRWVGKQRVNYKKFKNGSTSARMTESRVNLLDKIGFEWEASIKGKTVVWDKRYEELVSFVDEFGHARIPYNFPPNPSLGRWVNNQRKNCKNFREGAPSNRMTESRIKLLDEVGLNDRTVSL